MPPSTCDARPSRSKSTEKSESHQFCEFTIDNVWHTPVHVVYTGSRVARSGTDSPPQTFCAFQITWPISTTAAQHFALSFPTVNPRMFRSAWRTASKQSLPWARQSSRRFHPLATGWNAPSANLVPIVIEQTVGAKIAGFTHRIPHTWPCTFRGAANDHMIYFLGFCVSG